MSTSSWASVLRASSMSRPSSARVSIRVWMLPANQRIVAQLPPKKPSQRLRPTIRGRSHALASNSRIRPVASSVSRSMVLSAFLATRREFSASRFSSLAVNSSISLRSLSSRSPQPVGQIVRGRSHVRTVLLSAATGPRSWGPAP